MKHAHDASKFAKMHNKDLKNSFLLFSILKQNNLHWKRTCSLEHMFTSHFLSSSGHASFYRSKQLLFGRPATKGGQGAKASPGSNLALLPWSFVNCYLSYYI